MDDREDSAYVDSGNEAEDDDSWDGEMELLSDGEEGPREQDLAEVVKEGEQDKGYWLALYDTETEEAARTAARLSRQTRGDEDEEVKWDSVSFDYYAEIAH